MTRYEEGRRLEWQICAEFRRWGYMAQRTAGSHSPVDVVAVPLVGCGAVFVQAKLGKMTKAERAAFHSFCVRARADAILATKVRGKSAIIYSRVTPDGGTVVLDGTQPFGTNIGGCPDPVGEGQEAE